MLQRWSGPVRRRVEHTIVPPGDGLTCARVLPAPLTTGIAAHDVCVRRKEFCALPKRRVCRCWWPRCRRNGVSSRGVCVRVCVSRVRSAHSLPSHPSCSTYGHYHHEPQQQHPPHTPRQASSLHRRTDASPSPGRRLRATLPLPTTRRNTPGEQRQQCHVYRVSVRIGAER